MSGQPEDDPTGQGRCPSCGARVALGQQWCTLCHTPLAAGGAGAADPGRVTEEPSTDPGSRQVEEPGLPGLPGLPDAVAQQGTLPPGAAEAMLAELAADTAARRPLSSGPLAGTGKGLRLALAVGAAVVLTGLGIGLLTLVGLLL